MTDLLAQWEAFHLRVQEVHVRGSTEELQELVEIQPRHLLLAGVFVVVDSDRLFGQLEDHAYLIS